MIKIWLSNLRFYRRFLQKMWFNLFLTWVIFRHRLQSLTIVIRHKHIRRILRRVLRCYVICLLLFQIYFYDSTTIYTWNNLRRVRCTLIIHNLIFILEITNPRYWKIQLISGLINSSKFYSVHLFYLLNSIWTCLLVHNLIFVLTYPFVTSLRAINVKIGCSTVTTHNRLKLFLFNVT